MMIVYNIYIDGTIIKGEILIMKIEQLVKTHLDNVQKQLIKKYSEDHSSNPQITIKTCDMETVKRFRIVTHLLKSKPMLGLIGSYFSYTLFLSEQYRPLIKAISSMLKEIQQSYTFKNTSKEVDEIIETLLTLHPELKGEKIENDYVIKVE